MPKSQLLDQFHTSSPVRSVLNEFCNRNAGIALSKTVWSVAPNRQRLESVVELSAGRQALEGAPLAPESINFVGVAESHASTHP